MPQDHSLSPEQQARYARIVSHPLDKPEHAQSFSARLAQQNGWSRHHALRVIAEYQRFVFLALESGHVVSPSDAVDQAWHLHLCDSRDYWDEFCPKVLGTPLHHEPSRGGPREQAGHRDQYQQTLASYQRMFGQPAPADIWPAQPQPSRYVRQDVRGYWRIRKPGWRPRHLALAAVFICTGLLAGCAAVQDWQVLDYRGPDFLKFYLLALLGLFVFGQLWRIWSTWQGDSASLVTHKLDVYETAFLAGGAARVLDTSLLKFAQQDLIAIAPSGTLQRQGELTGSCPPFETKLFSQIRNGEPYRKLLKRCRSLTDPTRIGLEQAGMLFSTGQQRLQRLPVLAGGLGLWLLGMAKIGVGIARDKPVSALIIIVLLFTLVGLWRLLRQPTGLPLTRQGRTRLLQQKATTVSKPTDPGYPDQVLHHFALIGSTALIGTQWQTLRPIYSPASSSSAGNSDGGDSCSSNSGSSDSGGSSCGSSCGGCGGGGD